MKSNNCISFMLFIKIASIVLFNNVNIISMDKTSDNTNLDKTNSGSKSFILSMPNEIIFYIIQNIVKSNMDDWKRFKKWDTIKKKIITDIDNFLFTCKQLSEFAIKNEKNYIINSIIKPIKYKQIHKLTMDEVVKLIDQNHNNLNNYNDYDQTPLIMAAERGCIEIVEMLLKKNADVNSQNLYNFDALYYALINDQEKVAQLLINNGANISLKDIHGERAFFIAALKNHKEIVKLIIDKNFEKNTQITLTEAILRNQINQVKSIITNETNIDSIKTTSEKTPLMLAVILGHKEIVKLLIDLGSNINAQDLSSSTSLIYALLSRNSDIVKLLLDHGVKIDKQNLFGNTPLIQAADIGDINIVKLLIEAGANINIKNSNGTTALKAAALKAISQPAYIDIVKLLIKNNAEIDYEDKNIYLVKLILNIKKNIDHNTDHNNQI